jgi:toxin FitB
MYLLNTNVVSELRKGKTGKVNRNVSARATGVSPSTLFLSTISILELAAG